MQKDSLFFLFSFLNYSHILFSKFIPLINFRGFFLSLVSNTNKIKKLLFILLFVPLVFYGQAFINKGPLYEAQKELLNNFVEAWLREDAKGCASLYEKEAIYMIPGIPVIEGYTSILDSYKEQFSVRRDYKVTMEEPVIEVLPMGDWAMVRGVGNSTKIKNGVPLTRSYKWIILSRKQKDNSWKIVWDIFNYDHPINKNKNEEDAGFNKELVAVLDQIYFNDQSTRNTIGSWEEQYGRGSKEMNALWQEILKRDSINLIKVSKILEENGWPDKKVIGERGTSSLFLVIQHADQNTQEKYLPIIKKAMEDKNLPKRQYAMFYDRLLLRRGERQIYGTQLAMGKESKLPYVLPLEDPKNVDKRRIQMGLNTMQENLNRWKITWNVVEYIKSLPAIEAKEKELNIKNN